MQNKNNIKPSLSIHEMASGHFCPPPMYYHKQEVTSAVEYNDYGDYAPKYNVPQKRQNFISQEEEPKQQEQGAVNNVIMLNSDETKKL